MISYATSTFRTLLLLSSEKVPNTTAMAPDATMIIRIDTPAWQRRRSTCGCPRARRLTTPPTCVTVAGTVAGLFHGTTPMKHGRAASHIYAPVGGGAIG